MTNERSILEHIDELVAEEKMLRARHAGEGLSDSERQRMQRLEVELDQLWDLLRQRRAKSEFGDDPENAATREPGEVETYLQ